MRKRLLVLLPLLLAVFLFLPASRPVRALETLSSTDNSENVVIAQDRVIQDDVVTAAKEIDVRGTIDGDLYAFAETVNISGTVTGDVYAVAKTVKISGTVGDDIYAAGAEVRVEGSVADNATVAGSQVTFAEGSSVGRDLTAAGATLTADGMIGRFFTVASQTAELNGTANGVRGQTDELTVGPKAHVLGDVSITGAREPSYASGSQVEGAKHYQQVLPTEGKKNAKKDDRSGALMRGIGSWLFGYLGAVLAAAFVLLMMPTMVHSATSVIERKPIRAVGIGMLVILFFPIAFLLLLFTIVGIKLAFLMAALALFFLLASSAPMGLWLGHLILSRRRSEKAPVHDLWAMSLGLLIFALLGLIPFVGSLISFLVAAAGLGAFLLMGRGSTTSSSDVSASPIPSSEPPVPPTPHV